MASYVQKGKALYILEILRKKSDKEHRLTIADLIEELSEYGIKAERKSIYSDIALLNELGYKVVMHKSKDVSYYLESAPFTEEDLKLLTDAINSSPFIQARKCNELKKKLASLTSENLSILTNRPLYCPDKRHQVKEIAYQKTELLRKAIDENLKINFNCEETADGGFVLTSYKEITPFCIVWARQQFYLIAGSNTFEESLRPFAVKNMSVISLTDKAGEPLFTFSGDIDFNMQFFIDGLFAEDNEDTVEMTALINKNIYFTLSDKFHISSFIKKGNDKVFVTFNASESDETAATLIGFGDNLKLITPKEFISKIKRTALNVIEIYKNE